MLLFVLFVLLTVQHGFSKSLPTLEDNFQFDLDNEDNGVYKQCGKSRVCFGAPGDCVTSKNCTYLLSYGKKHSLEGEDQNKKFVQIVLYGKSLNNTYPGGFWSGFAVTTTASMDLAAVVQCARYSNGKAEVVAGFNAKGHSYETLKARHLGIHHPKYRYHNGYQLCLFELNVDRKVNGTVYDLKTPYNILLADGWINETSPKKYELKWHLAKPLITNKTPIACGIDCANMDYEGFDVLGNEQSVYHGCNKTRACVGAPANCVQQRNCNYLLSYGKAHANTVHMTLYGTSLNISYTGGFWSGFGITTTGSMDLAAVVQCAHYSDGSAEVVAGFNAANHSYSTLQDRHLGIHHPRYRFHNGYQLCSFQLDIQRLVNGSKYDLHTPYNILLADGWVNQTSPNTYDLKWHLEKPLITDKTVIACGAKCDSGRIVGGQIFL